MRGFPGVYGAMKYNVTNHLVKVPEVTPEFIERLRHDMRAARKEFREASQKLERMTPLDNPPIRLGISITLESLPPSY